MKQVVPTEVATTEAAPTGAPPTGAAPSEAWRARTGVAAALAPRVPPPTRAALTQIATKRHDPLPLRPKQTRATTSTSE